MSADHQSGRYKSFVGNKNTNKNDSTISYNTQSSIHVSRQVDINASNMAKILIIGETGSGKSTLINYLANYFRQGNLKNPKIAIPTKFYPRSTEEFTHCEQNIQDTTQSKTDDCNRYIFSMNSKHYLFIDTPGLSDTRSTSQDDVNIQKIIDLVGTLGSLTTIIVVVNGALARLTLNIRNVLIRLRGNLPNSVIDHIVVVLTNCTRYASNFTIETLAMNGNIYPYYMQNSAFSQNPKRWTNMTTDALQIEWNESMNEIRNMIETINAFKMKSTSDFKQMKQVRDEIKSNLHAAQVEVSQIQKIQDEIFGLETALSQANGDIITYSDYTMQREVDRIEIVDAPYHSTLCQNCNYVCHDKCGLEELPIVGSKGFIECQALKGDTCTQCPHKCLFTAHYHAKKTVVRTKETLNDILHDIKAKYDQASERKHTFSNEITSIQDAKTLLENALKKKAMDIEQLCHRLHEICSGFNLAEELKIVIAQFESESKMLFNVDAKQQADTFIRSLKDLCDIIANNQKDATINLPKMKIINTERAILGQDNQITTNSLHDSQRKQLDMKYGPIPALTPFIGSISPEEACIRMHGPSLHGPSGAIWRQTNITHSNTEGTFRLYVCERTEQAIWIPVGDFFISDKPQRIFSRSILDCISSSAEESSIVAGYTRINEPFEEHRWKAVNNEHADQGRNGTRQILLQAKHQTRYNPLARSNKSPSINHEKPHTRSYKRH